MHCEISSQWTKGLALVLIFPTVVSDLESDYFWRSYGPLCKKSLKFYKIRCISVKNNLIFIPNPPLEGLEQAWVHAY